MHAGLLQLTRPLVSLQSTRYNRCPRLLSCFFRNHSYVHAISLDNIILPAVTAVVQQPHHISITSNLVYNYCWNIVYLKCIQCELYINFDIYLVFIILFTGIYPHTIGVETEGGGGPSTSFKAWVWSPNVYISCCVANIVMDNFIIWYRYLYTLAILCKNLRERNHLCRELWGHRI